LKMNTETQRRRENKYYFSSLRLCVFAFIMI
jgi:hypothetical protein